MERRNYSNYTIKDAAIEIITDCIKYGKSEGWSGSLEELQSIQEICNTYNVYYVDDFNGGWKQIIPNIK